MKIKHDVSASTYPVDSEINFDRKSTDSLHSFLACLYTNVTGASLVHSKEKSIKYIIQEICDYYENLIAGMPGNIYWLDKQSRFLGCNDNVANMLSLKSRAEIRGLSHADVARIADWHEGQADSFRQSDMDVIETGENQVNVEEPAIATADGSQVIFLTTRVPLRDKKKRVIGVVGNSVDITELKKLQKDYANLQVREEHFKVLSSIGGMIAHELRTPLSAVKASMVTLEKVLPILVAEYESSLVERRVKKTIRRDRLVRLRSLLADVKQYIDYSQSIISTILSGFKYTTTNSNKELDIEPFVLADCVNEVLDYYPFTEIQRSLIDNQCTESLIVMGDKNVVVFTLQNLLKNALQSIDRASKGHITIKAQKRGNKAILVFTDTGSGIPKEALAHIFEAFYTTKEKEAMSIGLGLYFCRTALEKMSATINCNSQCGEYAQFEIALELAA